MGRPRNADSEETWNRIIDATLAQIAADDGSTDFAIRTVAEAAGVSPGTIGYYFPTKEALLEACLDRYYERLEALYRELLASASGRSLEDVLSSAVRRLYSFCRSEQVALRLRVRTRVIRGELPPQRQAQVLGPYMAKAGAALSAAAKISDVQARLAVQSLNNLITRYALHTPEEMDHILGQEGTQEDVVEHLVRVTLLLVTHEQPTLPPERP